MAISTAGKCNGLVPRGFPVTLRTFHRLVLPSQRESRPLMIKVIEIYVLPVFFVVAVLALGTEASFVGVLVTGSTGGFQTNEGRVSSAVSAIVAFRTLGFRVGSIQVPPCIPVLKLVALPTDQIVLLTPMIHMTASTGLVGKLQTVQSTSILDSQSDVIVTVDAQVIRHATPCGVTLSTTVVAVQRVMNRSQIAR